MKQENPHLGSSLDDLLAEDGTLTDVTQHAIKAVLAWQISRAMEDKGLSKTAMAKHMHTSRAALDRLLDPDNPSVTLSTLDRAAAVLGKRLRLDLVDCSTASG